jgi:leader peptidase (prepilin peptidase)/N-methyltransferase
MTGLIRTVLALFAGAMMGGVLIFVLLIARRITLKSFVPFGPFLIAGAAWAALLPASS